MKVYGCCPTNGWGYYEIPFAFEIMVKGMDAPDWVPGGKARTMKEAVISSKHLQRRGLETEIRPIPGVEPTNVTGI